MITEDYVNFEIAKLLKEKGFNEPCSHIYRNDGMHLYCGDAKLTTLTNTEIDEPQDWVSETFACACPTLQMAAKWLREVHSQIIVPSIRVEDPISGIINCYIVGIWYIPKNNGGAFCYTSPTPYNGYSSFEEACEAAIKYCLENLINNDKK